MAHTIALLLAAGESRRMGEPKALLPWRGRTLLAHQLDALRGAGVDRTLVVLGHRYRELLPEVSGQAGAEWVLNPDYRQGKTTSIKAGLAAIGSPAPASLLILNVDQPRSREMLEYLLRQHRASPALITIPTYRGQGGHPIILDGSLLPELMLIEEETQGLRAITQRYREAVRRTPVAATEALWDLNTPEQYRAALGESCPADR